MSRDPQGTAAAQFHPIHADWLNEQALEPVHEINEHFIELLTRFAAAGRHHEPVPYDLVRQLESPLARLSAAKRRRASQCLFVMVNFEFGNTEWWRLARTHKVCSVSTSLWPASVPRKLGTDLARALLNLAWHTARCNRDAARLILGLTTPVAEILAKLSQREIGALAERQFRQMRPRWEDRTFVWQQLLQSAETGDAGAWREFHLQGLRLVAGDFAPEG